MATIDASTANPAAAELPLKQINDPRTRVPLVLGDNNFTTVTDKVTALALRPTPRAWYIAFSISLTLLSLLLVTLTYLLTTGVGVWGNNNTVSWGFPIINFVFWVGIGHAGTLISAILFLLRQNWRTGINRFAEAMTIFAVICAGLFPAVHVGRIWLVLWLAPIPTTQAVWPQARSPLLCAVFGGFAMVLTLAIPARHWFGLQDLITPRHIENMAKVMLGTGLIVAYAYSVEFFMAWYSGHHYEQFVFMNRPLGPYWWAFFVMVFCNVVAPQFLWISKIRSNVWLVLVVAVFVNIGMWFERFVIVVTSLHRDYLPSSWASFVPTWTDLGMLLGSFGLFFTLFLLFCRFLPMVAMAEVKTVMPQAHSDTAPRRSDYQPDPDAPQELRRGHWLT